MANLVAISNQPSVGLQRPKEIVCVLLLVLSCLERLLIHNVLGVEWQKSSRPWLKNQCINCSCLSEMEQPYTIWLYSLGQNASGNHTSNETGAQIRLKSCIWLNNLHWWSGDLWTREAFTAAVGVLIKLSNTMGFGINLGIFPYHAPSGVGLTYIWRIILKVKPYIYIYCRNHFVLPRIFSWKMFNWQ